MTWTYVSDSTIFRVHPTGELEVATTRSDLDMAESELLDYLSTIGYEYAHVGMWENAAPPYRVSPLRGFTMMAWVYT